MCIRDRQIVPVDFCGFLRFPREQVRRLCWDPRLPLGTYGKRYQHRIFLANAFVHDNIRHVHIALASGFRVISRTPREKFYILESYGKRKLKKTRNANLKGVVLMASSSRIWKFVKSNLLRVYDVDLLGLFYDLSQQVSSFVRSTDVCSPTFRRDLLLQLLNPNHTMSAITALHAAAQLEVACLFFLSCVMSIYLSIDLSVLSFVSRAAAG